MTSPRFLDRLPLRDALFLGFCAGAIILCKILFRWHLGISGHSMFFTLIGLMVARSCVSYRWSATMTGLLAGLMAMSLGLGKGGPLILTKFVVPALVIDGALLLFPLALWSIATCVVVALLAGSTKFFLSWTQGTFLGMDSTVVLQRAAIDGVGSLIFSFLAALCVPPLLRQLKARGVIQDSTR